MNSSQLKKTAKIVNRFLGSQIKGDPSELYKAAAYLIVNGGKRLRPFMVLKSCQVLGGKNKDAMSAAGAVEMVHNFYFDT